MLMRSCTCIANPRNARGGALLASPAMTVGPKGPGVALAYGTAGFRAKAELLDSTFFRMGALAMLRSRARGGLAVGLMVTASHNAEPDNGIKLIDPDGGMLDQSWEAHATTLANAPDHAVGAALESLAAAVGVCLLPDAANKAVGDGREYLKSHGVEERISAAVACVLRDRPADPLRAIGTLLANDSTPAAREQGHVFIARDTRPHSERLSRLALEGVAHVGGFGMDCGLLTTPQLHHIVRHINGAAGAGPHVGPAAWASEAGYYEMLAEAYGMLVPAEAAASRGPLWVDAACGIGAPQLAALERRMGRALLPMTIANCVGDGALNEGCGAEYVQKGRKPPRGLEKPPSAPHRACSVDGDADRIVFHYWKGSEWRLLDGDKIAALFASFVCEELTTLALQPALAMAVVQTAYANGASGQYIRSLGVPVRIAKTGVKYVHHVAVQSDVAIYFEANGHGTLLFSDAAVDAISAAKATAKATGDAAKVAAAERLLASRQLINQAIGDAISDMLLVEAILIRRGAFCRPLVPHSYSLSPGLTGHDLFRLDTRGLGRPLRGPSLAPDEAGCRRPHRCQGYERRDQNYCARGAAARARPARRPLRYARLQCTWESSGLRFSTCCHDCTTDCGRCFVRPSGTEDVVRVYAEASTQDGANELALLVAQATWKLAGGVGDMPTSVV